MIVLKTPVTDAIEGATRQELELAFVALSIHTGKKATLASLRFAKEAITDSSKQIEGDAP